MPSQSMIDRTNLVWRVAAYMVMGTFTFLTVAPLVWLFYSSLKPNMEIVRNVVALPQNPTFQNFVTAWTRGRLGLYMVNSVIYAGVGTIITTFLALSSGYGFAKFKFKISGLFYFFYIIGLLITVHSVLVPLYVLETKLHIDDTRFGVLLPYVAFGMPFAIYLATSYIKGIPDALEESAVIDGAGYMQIFWHIIAPVARPVTTTILIFTFLSNWNEFVFVFTLTSKAALRSLPVGVNAFAGGMARDYGLMLAALVIATVPMLVFYAFFRDQIERGFSAGSVKE